MAGRFSIKDFIAGKCAISNNSTEATKAVLMAAYPNLRMPFFSGSYRYYMPLKTGRNFMPSDKTPNLPLQDATEFDLNAFMNETIPTYTHDDLERLIGHKFKYKFETSKIIKQNS